MIYFVSKNGMLCPWVRSLFWQINSFYGIRMNILLSRLGNDSTKQLNSLNLTVPTTEKYLE